MIFETLAVSKVSSKAAAFGVIAGNAPRKFSGRPERVSPQKVFDGNRGVRRERRG